MVRVIDGVEYPTAADAAAHFGVSTKTIHEWVRNNIIPNPPEVEHGAGVIRVYPPEYLEKAEEHLRRYRRRSNQRGEG